LRNILCQLLPFKLHQCNICGSKTPKRRASACRNPEAECAGIPAPGERTEKWPSFAGI
jgi:hypothetical protein